MDATTGYKTSPTFLLNGKAAILSYFTSREPAMTLHPQPGKDKNGLPNAVGGSLAAKVPKSIYHLIPALFRAALERFYSRPPPPLSPTPPPTPTPAPIRSSDATAFGLTTTAPFTAVLEAVLNASTDALAEALVLYPAASPAIQRLLLRRVRAAAAVQALHTDNAAAAGAGGDDGAVARVTSGADEAGSAAGQDKDADTGDAKGGTGGPTRDPSGRFTRAPLPEPPSSASAADATAYDDALEVAATVFAALRASPPQPEVRPTVMQDAVEFSALATKASAVSATVRALQLRFPLVHQEFYKELFDGTEHASDLTDLEPVLLALLSSHLDTQAVHVESLLTAMSANPLLASVAADADSVMAWELRLGRLGTPDPDPLEVRLKVVPVLQLFARVILNLATPGEAPEVAKLHAYLASKKTFTLVLRGQECLLETYGTYRELSQRVEQAGGQPSRTRVFRAWARALAAVMQPGVCLARIPDCVHPPSDLEALGLPSTDSPSHLSFLRFAQLAVLAAGGLGPDATAPPALHNALLACIYRYQAAASVLVAAAAAADGGGGGGQLNALQAADDDDGPHDDILIAHSRCTACNSHIPAISGVCHVCSRLLYRNAWLCRCPSPRIYAPTTATCRWCSSSDDGRRPTEADLAACVARIRGHLRGAAKSSSS